jgi:hypothetical protein
LRQKGKVFRIGEPPNRLEILNDIDGVESMDVFNNKVIGHYGNLKTFYIGLNELIKNKEVCRKKDYRKDTNDDNDYRSLLKVLKKWWY